MTLRLRVSDILEERDMTVAELSRRAKVVYRTALDLQKGNTKRIDLDTIEKVCIALDITPTELFEYTPAKLKK